MELKTYQQLVMADLRDHLNAVDRSQDIVAAWKSYWNEKDVAVAGDMFGVPACNNEAALENGCGDLIEVALPERTDAFDDIVVPPAGGEPSSDGRATSMRSPQPDDPSAVDTLLTEASQAPAQYDRQAEPAPEDNTIWVAPRLAERHQQPLQVFHGLQGSRRSARRSLPARRIPRSP